jgi:hypothetical protein
MRNFHNHLVIINREGLFPRLPVNPHERMASCTLTELKAYSMCLHTKRGLKNRTQTIEGETDKRVKMDWNNVR